MRPLWLAGNNLDDNTKYVWKPNGNAITVGEWVKIGILQSKYIQFPYCVYILYDVYYPEICDRKHRFVCESI